MNDIEEIKKILKKHEERLAKLERLFSSKPETAKKPISIKEFLISKKPKDNLQKTLAIAYYLENYEDFTSFNVSDLDKYFRIAKEKVPKNLNDMINKNIGKGYIMEAKEKKNNKKAFVLTSSGEEFVKNDFKKEK